MSVPPPPPPPGFAPSATVYLPPVPPPWTEHRAPGGQPYWFNPQTNVSTYTRPVAAAVPPPPPPGFAGPPLHFNGAAGPPFGASTVAPTAAPKVKEKKEKPREKIPIEGTDWIKVITNKDNVFFTNSATKASVWTVPDEIRDKVEELDRNTKKRKADEAAEREQEAMPAAEPATSSPKNKHDEVPPSNKAEDPPAAAKDGEIIVEPKKRKAKKPKVVHEIEELEQDEDWQRQVAEEMAKEAERAAAEPLEAEQRQEEKGSREADARIAGTPAIDVSAEEGAALFKAMLAEKDIQPMAPWDMELPKFIADPRYLAVKQLKNRRDLFDEFCKEKIREIRAAKKKAAESGGAKTDPLTAYRDLLLTAVTSTRTHFSDFKRAHGKDPRFRGFGKTEGEKEKVFKQWLRDLGERKRAEAEKAEAQFKEMLREDKEIKAGDEWVEVKTRHSSDPRYTAVNSSSLRESLFKKHLATLGSNGASQSMSSSVPESSSAAPKAATKEERAARAAASLREREEQVRAEKERVARSTNFAKGQLGREEGERDFGTLLVDKITDHEIRWDDAVPILSRDQRFANSPLPPHEQRRLFEAHLRTLYTRRLNLVEGLFAAHSPTLQTRFSDVLPHLTSSPHVKALVGEDTTRLEALYDTWAQRRLERSKQEFQEMLRESAILEHWGRLRKKAEAEGDRDQKIGMGEEGADDDSDEDEDVPSLGEMAKQVDEKAIHSVLKNDKRYIVFDHDPEARNRWVEEYLRNLQAPKTTVHQK